jgi:hypothetical protein
MGGQAGGEQAVAAYLSLGKRWQKAGGSFGARGFYSRRRERCGGGPTRRQRQTDGSWSSGNLMRQSGPLSQLASCGHGRF